MTRLRHVRSLVLAGCVSLAFPGCAKNPAGGSASGGAGVVDPSDRDSVEKDLDRYVGSGAYLSGIAKATTEARDWIVERAGRRLPAERLAVIIDVDETALSNLRDLHLVKPGSLPGEWNAWVGKAECPPIAPTLELFKAARQAGVDVIFMTGRPERLERASTEKNLRAVGYDGFALLVCNPNDGTAETTGAYKVAARRKLVGEGWTIIANVGDQESDLAGGYAERTFKLPNPFYITR